MTRRYNDPVEVRRAAETPAEFVWRGRIYSVRAVLGRWVEAGAWWRQAAPDAGGVLDENEREVWRVQAQAGRNSSAGVFDLAFTWSTGGWTLVHTHD